MQEQIKLFLNDLKYQILISPITKPQLATFNDTTLNHSNLDLVKFIPASGAATRMFSELFNYIDSKESSEYIETFLKHKELFAFYDDLFKSLIDKKNDLELVNNLLNKPMNYGSLPKALLKVHQYENGALTPIEEHIYEGEQYLNKDHVSLHFTISKEHESLFNDFVQNVVKDKPHVKISYSFQKDNTNTLAVTLDNQPFIDDTGEPLYRAGGHGALIENLNDINADVIFIKNIDNVCHQNHIEDTIKYKKILLNSGIEVKNQIDTYMNQLISNKYDLTEINRFLKEVLNINYKHELTKEKALWFLNRPLRVCGVVKNQGEVGGGPFIVDNGDYTDPQILEMSEIDLTNVNNKIIVESSEYFNPVDLVCFVKDYKGDKFNLLKFINHDRYFISEKTYKGRPLKALEHPGLWNGAMHYWNTIFMEVPLNTFNPIKTVNDLLRKGHRP